MTGFSVAWITRPLAELATYEAAGWTVDRVVTIRPETARSPRGSGGARVKSGIRKIEAVVLCRPRTGTEALHEGQKA